MRRDDARLLDILLAARAVVDYVRGATAERFEAESQLHDAVIRQLEIVGEAAGRLSDETRALHPGLPWRKMAGLRNILAHEYFQVNLQRIWQIAQADIPDLIRQLEPLVPPEIP